MNRLEYFAKVARVREKLPTEAYLVSTDAQGMRAGVVMLCGREVAARAIVDGTHVLASQEQVDALLQHEAAEKARIETENMKAKQQMLTADPAMIAAMMSAFYQQNQTPAAQPTKGKA